MCWSSTPCFCYSPPCLAMYWLSLTLVLSSSYLPVQAGYQTKGQNCSSANNRLQIGTYQFYSDCDIQTYCTSAGVCELKGCRSDQFPFGYAQNATLPPKCPSDQFCPDEGDACQPLLAVGSPCQLNRDGECSFHRTSSSSDFSQTNVNLLLMLKSFPKLYIMVETSTVLYALTMSACTPCVDLS